MNSLVPSLVRTVVPILYGLLVHFGVLELLGLDSALVVNFLTAVVTGLLYLVIRLAETKLSPLFGWLLGLPKPPSYE